MTCFLSNVTSKHYIKIRNYVKRACHLFFVVCGGRLFLAAAPFEVGVEFALAGQAHLEFAGEDGVFSFVEQAELRAGSSRVGEEDGGGGCGGGYVVVDDVAFVVEVDSPDGFALRVEVEEVGVFAVEVGWGFATGVAAVAGEDMVAQLGSEG